MSVPAERWRKPIKVHSVDEENLAVFTDREGRTRYRPTFVLESRDDFERIRLGYACICCLEPFERPFPETCNVCGFQVERDQPSWMLEELNGEYKSIRVKSGESVRVREVDAVTGARSRIWTP